MNPYVLRQAIKDEKRLKHEKMQVALDLWNNGGDIEIYQNARTTWLWANLRMQKLLKKLRKEIREIEEGN